VTPTRGNDTPAGPRVHVERLDPARHLDGLLAVEQASFTNPSGRAHYEWEIAHSDVSRVHVLLDETDAVVGYCASWVIFDELHINTMAVAPDRRCAGLGRLLLAAVLEAGRAEGARRATLEVRSTNTAARALYARFGFEPVGVRRGYYTRPPDDALLLSCGLEPTGPARPAQPA